LSGNLKEGEIFLRQASTAGNDARIRQNLALVIGLQGRFEEAETLVKQDTTPEQAESNVQMLKAMLGQQKQAKKRS
jgi:Flp pilus assembly protein TadD